MGVMEIISLPWTGFLRVVFLANHMASTDNLTRTTKTQNTHKPKQTLHKKWPRVNSWKHSKTYAKTEHRQSPVQSPSTTSGPEMEWVYSVNPWARTGPRGFGEMRYSRQARYRFLTRRNHSQNLNPGLLGLSPASWPLSHGSSSLAWLISRIFLSCIYYARKKKKNSYPMYLSLPADHVPQLLQTMFSYAIRI